MDKETILNNINYNIDKYSLFEFYNYLVSIEKYLISLYNIFDSYDDVKFKSRIHSCEDVIAEVLAILHQEDNELYKMLLDVATGKNPDKIICYVQKEESKNYGRNECVEQGDRKIMIATLMYNSHDFNTFAHESGHLLASMNRYNDLLSEIESFFMEKFVSYEMVQDGTLSKEEYENNLKAIYVSLTSYIEDILSQVEVLSNLRKPINADMLLNIHDKYEGKEEAPAIQKAILDLTTPESTELLNYKFRYIVGEIVTYHMMKEYKLNKKEVLDKYKEFIDFDVNYTIDEASEMLINMKFTTALEIYIKEMGKDIIKKKY